MARDRLQLARGDHLGQQHGRGLQRLDLLLGIGAAGAVLHHEHAERRPAAQHGHAEERLIDFFARLRLVGKGRMRLRVRERKRFRGFSNQADEALAAAHGCQMDCFSIQAFGRIKFQPTVSA